VVVAGGWSAAVFRGAEAASGECSLRWGGGCAGFVVRALEIVGEFAEFGLGVRLFVIYRTPTIYRTVNRRYPEKPLPVEGAM
jgi:hypothetical protein